MDDIDIAAAPLPSPLPADPAPFFNVHVFVCTNRRGDGHKRGSCAAEGSEKLRDYFKARLKELGVAQSRVNTAGCLDRCECGPVAVIYPEGVWYHLGSRKDVDDIIDTHILGGGRVQRLMLRPEDECPPHKRPKA